MSDTKHTPGPWRRLADDVVSDHHTHAGLVAAIYGGGLPADSEWREETEANMGLVIAAPELLAAGDAVAKMIGFRIDDPRCKLLDKLRAAIAKAKGE